MMKFRNLKVALLSSAAGIGAIVMPAVSHAAITSAQETAILAGVSSSDETYYVIGAGLLVVVAGIWGFKKVLSLLGR